MVPNECIVENRTVAVNNDTYYNDNCKYRVAEQSHSAIRNMLNDMSLDLVADLTDEQRKQRPDGSWSYTWNHRNPSTTNLNNARHSDESYMIRSIEAMWDNMAFASSENMRRASSYTFDNKTLKFMYIKGTMQVPIFYHSIDWKSLVMPAFVVLLCALFVLHTALRTKNEHAWRKLALPLLFHGLEDGERSAHGDLRDFTVMQDVAENMRVRLEEHVDNNGARLVTQGRWSWR